MEEKRDFTLESVMEQEDKNTFDFQSILKTIILNWQWFLLALIISLGVAALYLRYVTPIYQARAKMLIKEEDGNGNRRGSMLNMANLGMMTNSTGIDNEMEILKSHSIAERVVRDLKLYVTYIAEGKIKDRLVYSTQPITVDIDEVHLNKMTSSIPLQIIREGKNYHITGTYYVPIEDGPDEGPFAIDKTFSKLPATISTRAGILTFTKNGYRDLKDGSVLKVRISPVSSIGNKYASALSVAPTSKTTTIAALVLKDEIPQRAIDYLKQLVICYNEQANEDKNEVAFRTEAFINDRLEKINAELGSTESELEAYKKRNKMVQLSVNANQAINNANQYEQRLEHANTQVALLNSLQSYMDQPENKYQTLPTNVGLSDQTASHLINKYNEIALERNRLLRSASENSPTVIPLTSQLDDLSRSINGAMAQSRKNMEIERNSIASQFGKYTGQVSQTPEQEHMLSQIGRQQEVKSGLYLMLLQKREENSIELAATADKGKMIDVPVYAGQVSPKSNMIMLIALILGLAVPAVLFFLLKFFRYKIEGHDDVVRLTKLPLIADVAVASDTAKSKADIVVHENKNNQMEEIFRSMRTNLQFMMKEGEKVILFTSTTSGEGKTFNAANLAVSFALLDKQVIIVGLDIRKPRLAELFEIDDHKHGITPLLSLNAPTWDEVKDNIVPSGVNNKLDLLLAGPVPPNPTELIARPSLEIIMGHLKDHYDYIIIDTAPVGLVTDTLQIGRVADATVYMCRADYTPRESFNLINSLSNENKLPNMSIVLNGIDMSKKKYGYYYGYGRYGKYGRYGRYNSRYGRYGNYGSYGSYGTYGSYGNYSNSHYGDKNDTSVKR